MVFVTYGNRSQAAKRFSGGTKRKKRSFATRTLYLDNGKAILRIKAKRSGSYAGTTGNNVYTSWKLDTGNQRILVRFYYPDNTVLYTSILSYFPSGDPATDQTNLSWVAASLAATAAGNHFSVKALGVPGGDTSWSDASHTYGNGGLLSRGK